MTPEYRYTLDPEYLRVAEARAFALLPAWRRLLARYVMLAVCVWLCLFFVWRLHDQPGKLALFLGVTVLAFGYQLLKLNKQRRERFKGTPLENARVQVSLSEGALEVELDSSRSRADWSVISRARAFEDGLLLFEGGIYRWLPHAALQGATRAEAEERVRTKVADFARAS